MNQVEAEKILQKAVKNIDKPAGRLFLQLIDEDPENYYYDVCVIPEQSRVDLQNSKQIANRYAISPPWFVNKKTGEAGISWGMPEEME